MNVVKCANGHFFDGDTYTACPHCGAPVGNIQQTAPISQPKEKKGLFGGKNKKNRNAQTTGGSYPGISGSPYSAQPYGGYVAAGFHPTAEPPRVTTEDVPVVISQPQPQSPDVTLDFWNSPVGKENAALKPGVGPAATPEPICPQEEPAEATGPVAEESAPVRSLMEEVRQASASEEGKTMSYFSAMTAAPAAGAGATESVRSGNSGSAADPVVGWLVAVSGRHFGESFAIGAGMNSIGRGEDNRIVLKADPQISRNKHTFVLYEPKRRRFFVRPGESSGLTYVNEDVLTESRELASGDILELGGSRLLFVPLCGDNFSWESYIGQKGDGQE